MLWPIKNKSQQMQWYASHNKMETPHQYSMSIDCPARGSLPCVWKGTVEQILCLWPWFLGQVNGDDGVDAATLGREAVKCVLRKIIDATHEISHLSHVRDATNAILQEPMVPIIPSPSCQFMKTGPTAMNLRR